MGIHYDYKSTKSAKLMEKQAKREKKLAEKKAKRLAKEGTKTNEAKDKTLDASKPITLDFLTNPKMAKDNVSFRIKASAFCPKIMLCKFATFNLFFGSLFLFHIYITRKPGSRGLQRF